MIILGRDDVRAADYVVAAKGLFAVDCRGESISRRWCLSGIFVAWLWEAACWAHMRRDFHDFWASTKSEIAREALDRIGKLYDIERDINGQPADVRHAARQKLSQPKVEASFAWSEQQLERIPGKSDLAKAFRYGEGFLMRVAA